MTARYKDGAGTVVKTVTESDGSLDLSFLTSATPGTWTLEVVNNSATRNVPSTAPPTVVPVGAAR